MDPGRPIRRRLAIGAAAAQGTQLWLYHVDGGSGVNLTGSDERRQLDPLGAAVGKDQRFVYFTERTAAGSVYNQMNVPVAARSLRPPHR